MRLWTLRAIFFLLGGVVLTSTVAPAETDVAASLYGAFTGTTNGNGTVQSPSNAAGVLFEMRHISNPLVGYEATYSYNRANQVYTNTLTPPCPVGAIQPCGPETNTTVVSANAHEITGDWMASVHIANFRPFALAGGGLLFGVPSSASATTNTTVCGTVNPLCVATSSASSTSTQTKGVFVYGAGLDWGLIAHLGLRFQYRGNLYKAPNLVKLYTSTGAFTHTAEPMIGAYFRF